MQGEDKVDMTVVLRCFFIRMATGHTCSDPTMNRP